jgi:hypothetical protein
MLPKSHFFFDDVLLPAPNRITGLYNTLYIVPGALRLDGTLIPYTREHLSKQRRHVKSNRIGSHLLRAHIGAVPGIIKGHFPVHFLIGFAVNALCEIDMAMIHYERQSQEWPCLN